MRGMRNGGCRRNVERGLFAVPGNIYQSENLFLSVFAVVLS